MDRQTNRQKNENATEIDKILQDFFYMFYNGLLHLIYFSALCGSR